jgi:cell division protein FtsI/penicillin-binding protein 2
MELGRSRFHCWKRHGHGWLGMHDGIKQSCDVYFYDIARRAGIDRISEMAVRLGLGEATGIELPGERAGVIPTRAWKQAVIGDPPWCAASETPWRRAKKRRPARRPPPVTWPRSPPRASRRWGYPRRI